MISYSTAFSSFSVDDQETAKAFYENVLGAEVVQTPMGLELHVKGSDVIFMYEKNDHVPATFTVVNFVVDDIDVAVDQLLASGCFRNVRVKARM